MFRSDEDAMDAAAHYSRWKVGRDMPHLRPREPEPPKPAPPEPQP